MEMVSMLLIYGVFFAVLWFFIMRPQKKEQKPLTLHHQTGNKFIQVSLVLV